MEKRKKEEGGKEARRKEELRRSVCMYACVYLDALQVEQEVVQPEEDQV